MMRVLLERGYGVSFIPAHREVGPSYVAAVRELGVHVLPMAPPDKWALQEEGGGGRCLYDAVLVARRSIFESCRDVLKQKCPGARVIYDTGAPPFGRPGISNRDLRLPTAAAMFLRRHLFGTQKAGARGGRAL